jgi:hypothetical protein
VFRAGVGRIPRITWFAVVFAMAAPATASAWMPEPVQFSKAVPASKGAHAAGAGRTVTVRTGRRFDLLGLEWRGARSLRVELRTRDRDGHWTRWARAAASDDGADGPEARGGRTFSDPIWVGGADRVQLRLSRPAAGLRLRLVNTTGSATAADRARTRAKVRARGHFGAAAATPSAGMPPIIPRADWGASRCKPRTTPAYGSVRVAYVHHTVSLNGYSRSRAASVVLGVCLFHRNSRGWNDIGYDFLIDRYGRVFEGRAGGVDAPVIGAQAGGFNSESTGVSMIGNFARSAPPRAAMDSLARLLAWKLGLHGAPATGKTQVTSAGGPSTGYRAGTRVTVNRISGHRDVDLTSCPGSALYRRLPALRRQVAALQGPISQVSLGPIAQRATYGSGFSVSGTLTVPEGLSPDGAPIEVRRHQNFGSETIATATAGPDGSWSALVPPAPADSALSADFPGDGVRPGAVSDTAYVTVVPRVDLAASSSTVPAGKSVTATGSVAPSKARVRVTAYLVRPDGSQRRAAVRTVRVVRGSFKAGVRLRAAGTYRLVARVGADRASAGARSRAVEVVASPTG